MADVTPVHGAEPERQLPKIAAILASVTAVALSLFQLYTAGIVPLGLFYQRSIHLAFILVLAFLLFPVFGKTRARGVLGWLIDGALILGQRLRRAFTWPTTSRPSSTARGFGRPPTSRRA